MRKTIHIISRQVGTAYPHGAFIKVFQDNGFQVEVFAYSSAHNVLKSFASTLTGIDSFSDYQSKIHEIPDLIFTGTSEMANDDSQYWSWAFEKNIPSVAWLDQIVNLEKRFLSFNDKKLLPKIILTNDRATLNELKSINITTQIECVGSPYIDELVKNVDRTKKIQRMAVFASEPTFADFKTKNGFDDIDSYFMACDVLQKITNKTGEVWNIFVKLHPRDSAERFSGELSRRYENCTLKTTNLSKEEILSHAHIILGMRSMFLFESANLGIPTLSFQPQRKTNCSYLDQHKNVLSFNDDEYDLNKLIQFVSSDKNQSTEVFSKNQLFDILKGSFIS